MDPVHCKMYSEYVPARIKFSLFHRVWAILSVEHYERIMCVVNGQSWVMSEILNLGTTFQKLEVLVD